MNPGKHTAALVIISICLSTLAGAKVTAQTEALLKLSLNGKSLTIEAYLPKHIKQFELRIASDRNKSISRFSTISPFDPDSVRRKERYNRTAHETWFPVIDFQYERGMEGVCTFRGKPEGYYTFGGPYYTDKKEIASQIIIPGGRLEPWENSLRVDSKAIEVENFYVRKIYPVLLQEFRHSVRLLSEDWSGSISIYSDIDDGGKKLAEGTINSKTAWKNEKLEASKGQPVTRSRLLTALKATIRDGLRRQNPDPGSPTYGSFHTFYDFDAKLHRTAYWLWGGSPIVKMTLDALALVPEIRTYFDSTKLVEAMDKVGQLYLKYQIRDENHPSCGSFLVIWTRKPSGYSKWVGMSDSGIMHKWAIIPLYKATGNEAYLEAAKFWCRQKGKHLKDVEILPHYYLYDEGRFADGILDETGWDPEGHAALYEVTGDDECKEIARKYIDKHMAKFQNEDGMWNRNYSISRGTAQKPSYMTRGTGWAMEGLLAMNTLYPDSIYLEYAKKMAGQVMENQNNDGSWNFVFNAADGSPLAVKSDKATPLWSLLFYRLYHATRDEQYLKTAFNALKWCLENQYTGPDPEAIGGLVGRTNASMVGYRYYYDATCAYATGFFGLAILEQLKIIEAGEN